MHRMAHHGEPARLPNAGKRRLHRGDVFFARLAVPAESRIFAAFCEQHPAWIASDWHGYVLTALGDEWLEIVLINMSQRSWPPSRDCSHGGHRAWWCSGHDDRRPSARP